MTPDLDEVVRAAGGRVRAALAVRFRDLDLAEDAFADACAAAVEAWRREAPRDGAAWLYAAASRKALDRLRRRAARARAPADPPPAPIPTAEDLLTGEDALIPDERLRLIFVCCHPAVSPDARAALTLRMVCGLSTVEIAEAFLTGEATLAQRLVRAKRKIAEAGVPFEVPGPEAWPERMEAVLSTLEVAYAKAYEDAAGAGAHAGFAEEVLRLASLLAELTGEPEALGLAALVRFAEARRPARLDDSGAMVPVGEQDPSLWRGDLIAEGEALLRRAEAMRRPGPRQLQAAIHAAHCARRSLGRTPWRAILTLYDALLEMRPDAVVGLNRTVALAEVAGAEVAWRALDCVAASLPEDWPPLLAVRADLAARTGRSEDAARALDALLARGAPPAERLWLERRRRTLA